MKTYERTPTELRDAYYELSMAEGLPDPGMLDALISRYPQYARELTSFAVDLTVDRLTQDDVTSSDAAPVMGSAASTAVSAYHNAMYSLRKGATVADTTAAASVIENPFVKLDRDGIRATANAVGVNTPFVIKLRDRVIDAGTIPQRFLQQLAEALGVEFERLWSHLSCERIVAMEGQSFKADDKPLLGQKQSFEEAVRSSGLSQDQQTHLLSL